MDNIIAAALWRRRGILSTAAFTPSNFNWFEAGKSHRMQRYWGRVELSTTVDNFVRNFTVELSFTFNALTGDHHA